MKLWYAALRDNEDQDWGTGSFDFDEAVAMAKEMGEDSIVTAIDGNYDDDGNATSDEIAVAEYHNGEDF